MAVISARRVLLLAVIVIGSTIGVAAQSGRRGTAKSTAPTVPAVSETQPTPSTGSKPQKTPALQLLVGVEDPSPLSRVPQYFADTALEECLRRLNEPAGVAAQAGSRRMARSDAIKAAKVETATYVVWLQVGSELSDSAPQASNSADETFVEYMVLEPGTAKVKQSGRVRYSARKAGNVGVGPPPGSRRDPAYAQFAIREEAREAADRILRAFGIRTDGTWPR